MKKIVLPLLFLFIYKASYAQNEPYYGGVGRGDVHLTQTNILLGNPLIYYGGVGRGDVHLTQTNTLLGDPLIYYGGVGRGDVHLTQTNILLGDPLIYYGGVGRGDVHLTQTNILLGDPLIYYGGVGRGDVMINKLATLGGQVLWRGGASGTPSDWNNAQNWWPDVQVPNQTVSIWLENNSNGHNPVLDQNRTVHSINFNGANKQVVLNNYNLTVSSDVVGFDANNHFKTNGTGKLQLPAIANSASVVFPIGNSAYNPVTITNNTGSSDTFSVRVIDAVLKQGFTGDTVINPHVKITWDITKSNGNANSGSGIDLTFQWNSNQEFGVIDEYALNHYNASNWEIASGTSGIPVVTTVKTLMHTGYMGTFSPFAIGNSYTSPLPVSLISFTGNCLNSIAEIKWVTASEFNSAQFIIERSSDLLQWEKVTSVTAAGYSNSVLSYGVIDKKAYQTASYYRLKQQDLDGTIALFPPIYLDCNKNSNKNELSLFPNPVVDNFNVSLTALKAVENAQLMITNMKGIMVKSIHIDVREGFNIYTLNSSNLKPGLYLLHLSSQELMTKPIKFLIIK